MKTLIDWLIGAVLALCIGAFLYLLLFATTGRAHAEECAANLGDTVAAVESAGGELIDLVDVRSDHFDQIVIVELRGALIIGGVKEGCMVTPPIPLDTVREVTPA